MQLCHWYQKVEGNVDILINSVNESGAQDEHTNFMQCMVDQNGHKNMGISTACTVECWRT